MVGGVVASTAGVTAVFWLGALVVLASGLGGFVVTDAAVERALADRDRPT